MYVSNFHNNFDLTLDNSIYIYKHDKIILKYIVYFILVCKFEKHIKMYNNYELGKDLPY